MLKILTIRNQTTFLVKIKYFDLAYYSWDYGMKFSTCALSNPQSIENLQDLQVSTILQPKLGPRHLKIMTLLLLFLVILCSV